MLLTATTSFAQNSVPVQDTPYMQDYHEAYLLSTPAENDVRSIVLDAQQRVWAGTGAGVRYLENGKWKTPPGGAEIGPVNSMFVDSTGKIWGGGWDGLYSVTMDQVLPTSLGHTPIGVVHGRVGSDGKESLFAGGPDGIWRLGKSGWAKIKGRWHPVIRALMPTDDNQLLIGTPSGLYAQSLDQLASVSKRLGKPDVLLSSNINALTMDAQGDLWIGSTGGLDHYHGLQRVNSLSSPQKIPNRNARAISQGPDGRLWVATKLGVVRWDGKSWSLRHSRRWLQSDDARDVVVAKDGTGWVATSAGVDSIRSKKMTLEEKAAYYDAILRKRHIRPPGLVGPTMLDKQGDLSSTWIIDDDNDGEHTGMYCAAESFRYAVTHDPQAQEYAKEAFHALELLQSVTSTNYFIARTVVPMGTEPKNEKDRTFTPIEISDTHRTDPRERILNKRWLPSKDGKWLFKIDTSSDEVDGHMCGFSTYYDLAADEAEKKRIAKQVDILIGGIVDHGYLLVDMDGKPTRWGNWSPESLNSDPVWNEERPGNSLEMLAYLGVAFHQTGNPRYLKASRDLIDNHGYAQNAMDTNFATPAEHTHIVDELLGDIYPSFMEHMIDPALKETYQKSIQNWYKSCSRDNIPYYDFVYNKFSGKSSPLEPGVNHLREWPLNLIEWTVDSSKREDIELDLTPGLDEGFIKNVLPRSEMGLVMWDQEPYHITIGLNGMREDKPMDWLLAYWMGRYYGFISAPIK